MPRAPALSRAVWTVFSLAHAAGQAGFSRRSAARIRALRDRRVRAMVAHAFRTVPHYRAAMIARGLTPSDFRVADDLARLPLIDGADLAVHPEMFRSSAFNGDAVLELTTSGRSGHLRRVLYDRRALFFARAVGLREREVVARYTGRRFGYREMAVARAGGTRPVIHDFYARGGWVPGCLEVRRSTISPEDPFERNLERINGFRPDVMVGFGAYIGTVYRWAWLRDRPLHRPAVISYGGDTMVPGDRRLLEEQYGVPVLSTYQACEALHIGFECEHHRGFHLHEDQVVVRIVDGQGRTVPAGAAGEVVVSNLTNRATVLLNYRLGDLATAAPAGPCPCGRSLPLLQSLDGRCDDLVVRPGGEIAHESVILPRLYDVPGVLQVQLDQLAIQSFHLRVLTGPDVDWPATRSGLAASLRAVLGHGEGLALEVERVADIPCGPGGKLQSIRSACPLGSA